MNIEKRLSEIATRKAEIRSMLENNQDIDLNAIKSELETLEQEERSLQEKKQIMDSIANGTLEGRKIDKPDIEVRDRDNFSKMSFNGLISQKEYRTAFLKKLQSKPLNETEQRAMAAMDRILEQRALTTGITSAGAAVPTQTLNMVVEKLRQITALFPLVTQLNIPGGLSIPRQNAINDASWHAEGAAITAVDDTVNNVTLFGYELVRLVQVSRSVEAMAIDAFETFIVDQLAERMSVAIENAIINGSGSTNAQPTGILTGVTWSTTNSATYATTGLTYKDITKALGLLPVRYRQFAKIVLNSNMLYNGVMDIMDNYGRPIFYQNPNDDMDMRLFGKPIVLDEYTPDNTIIICQPSYYYWNFSQQAMIEKSYESSFKENLIDYKGTLVADGKPVLDEAFVKLTEATS
jgi:HK97 family phage major capsid protein